MSNVKVIGVPYTAGTRVETSYTMDQQNGPNAIRATYQTITRGYDVPKEFEDLGDLRCDNTVPSVLKAVEEKVGDVMRKGEIPFLLGGVHTFSLASFRALSRIRRDFSVIYFDAHPDLMPHPEINYGSHMFYAIEEGVVDPKRLAFLGIRQVERPERKILDDHGIFNVAALEFEGLSCAAILSNIRDRLPPPYYFSIDLDVLSPCEAPGVGNPYPGGIQFRELLYIANELCKSEVLGIEIVQLSPLSDRNDETAAIAAVLLQQLSMTIAAKTVRH